MNATPVTTTAETLALTAEPFKPAKKKSKSAEFIATFRKHLAAKGGCQC